MMVFKKKSIKTKNYSHSKHEDYLNKGKEQYQKGHFHDALRSFEKALNNQPKSYRAWNWKGNALRRLDQDKEALLSYDKAISFDRFHSYVFPYIGKGDVCRKKQLFDSALLEYDKAIRIRRHPYALNGKAQCLYETGKKDHALRLAEEVIRMRPSLLFPYILEGDIFYDRGSYRDAIPKYEKAISLLNNSSNLHNTLGNKIQNCQTALDQKRLIENQPQNTGPVNTQNTTHFPSSPSDKSDYTMAYHIAKLILEHLKNNKLQEAMNELVHLEGSVSGEIIDRVKSLRDRVNFCIDEEMNVSTKIVSDAETLKEMIHQKAMN